MKKKLILMALCAVGMLSITACSDGPEDGGRVDVGLIQTLSRDGSVSTYKISDFNVYEKDTSEGAAWKEFNYKDYDGFVWPDMSSTLCFQDGHLWEAVETFSISSGTYLPYKVWQAYCKFSGEKDKKFYVRIKFTYDETTHIMKMGNSSLDYYVKEFTENRLRMEKITPVKYASGELKSYHKYTYEYKATEPIRFDGEDVMAFDSNAECYRYWVNLYREKFGNYVDMNEYYSGSVILDKPIIDLDAVDAWIDNYERRYHN